MADKNLWGILISGFIIVAIFLGMIIYPNINNPRLIPALLVLGLGVGGSTFVCWRQMNKQPNRKEDSQ